MSIPELVAIVLAGTQFIKELLAKFKIIVKGTGAIILSVLVSAAVCVYFQLGQPFTLNFITNFIQVAIAANMGYKVLSGRGSVN